jgi:Fe-S oxidoreductase
MDLMSFVDRMASPPQLTNALGTPPVTVHQFCQSTNVLGLGDVGARLLRRAGVPVLDLPEASVCCGFGGATSLEYPEIGRGIVERKLQNVRTTGAKVLATDNPGCLLHLRGAVEALGEQLEVRHVAEILADAVASERSGR